MEIGLRRGERISRQGRSEPGAGGFLEALFRDGPVCDDPAKLGRRPARLGSQKLDRVLSVSVFSP